MRVVATEYVSLDGVFEEPGVWSGPWFNDECGEFKDAELRTSDALLLGRKTYEGFAAAWPAMREVAGEFGAKFNDMPKYVVSRTLKDPEWTGSQVREGDPVEAVRALRERPGNDLLLNGSGQLFNTLLRGGVIDVVRLMLYPVVLGSGAKLFADGGEQTPLTLSETKTFSNGVMILDYTPAAR
jgi:dihydrofolate reductase